LTSFYVTKIFVVVVWDGCVVIYFVICHVKIAA